ncbi:hypothetical protein D9757_003408 [Collybiopsis confluens]|uniref:RecF/RecN/SMC N-terminal domain-containing protein n=1 Tax=Collybiopsis confluens TaxID=2823264 RepID=A0A8H5HTM1_9AGAR|nr:hypothetical protein D9757_003408 [Collybiopsis confluens]
MKLVWNFSVANHVDITHQTETTTTNTMAKRRVDSDSDDEQVQSASPASKRARTAASDDEDFPTTQQRKGKGKGHADERDSSDDEDQEMQDLDDSINDEQFEEQFQERIEKAVDAKRLAVGGIAEHGIIESIEMHHFMCHKYLSFQFGPQINFIIGHNGSGKSAVLSAITIALGGKSNSTGRGTGLKSFIREGQPAAEVTISLKNQGEEAYKPKEYGKSILITRRFTKEGSSTWKIRGTKSNHVISTKREELSAICDHMNIQVDNPMNVLTQDAARQFLSASAPADKYKFFLRGTQLSQLATEYETCLENITNTTNILKNKKDAIPDLKQAFREASAKYQEAAQALKQKEKARELKIELAWAHVRVKQKEMQQKMVDVEQARRHLEKIQENLQTAKLQLEQAGEDVKKHEDEINGVGQINNLIARKNELKDQIKVQRNHVATCTNELREIDTSTFGLNQTIAGIEKAIDMEMARLAADTQEKRETFQRKMDEAQTDIENQEEIIRQLADRKVDAIRRKDIASKEGEDKQAELHQLKQNIDRIDAQINQLQRTEQNKWSAYEPGMAQVIGQIEQTRWFGDVPLGPLGRYVKVRDPDSWADLLAHQLGGVLTSFAVTDSRDRDILVKLLERSRITNTNITIFDKDLFDYSQGEPDREVLTVLRAMEFDNPYVERLLINANRIERLVLTRSRKEAEHALRRIGDGFAWTQDLFVVRRFREGGGSTNPLGKPDRSQLLRNEDNATRIRYLRGEKDNFEAQYGPLAQEVQRLRGLFVTAKQEEARTGQDDRAANKALARAKQAIINLQAEAREDEPVNIQALQEAKQGYEQEKQDLQTQFGDIVRKKEQHGQKVANLLNESKELTEQINSFNERQSEIRGHIEKAAEARMKAQGAVQHFERKVQEAETSIDAKEATLKTTEEEFANWTASASEIGERVETNKKPDDIQRQMDTVKNILQERERRQGASVDDIVKELNSTKEKLERAQKDYKQMVQLNKILRASLCTRLARWQEFRRHIALRCKMVFRYNLSQRGYFGNILFNHSEGTLSLKARSHLYHSSIMAEILVQVQTEDHLDAQGGSKEKDPRSLSGGEKSFSTICLLLSLWESIGCPLRCLDEFDVFMDAVNRRISMKMMIDTANQSDKKQYILITPQDMNNIKIGPSVRVHRMTDPERGQGILAMS